MGTLYIHHPLETGLSNNGLAPCPHVDLACDITYQRTNHDNPNRQSVPQSREADILIDPAHRRSKGLARQPVNVQFADHYIRWVRHNGTEDTGQVSTSEGDCCLSPLVVVRFLPGKVVVDSLDNGLK